MRSGFLKNKKVLYFILWNLLLIIPSFRFFLKHTNLYILVVFILASNFFFYTISNYKSFFNKYNLTWVGISIISIFIYFIYPLIDARSLLNSGSTGDDALKLAAISFKNSGKMYDMWIDKRAPISTGPGWVLLNSVFVYTKTYFLFIPFYLFLTSFLVTIFLKKKVTNYFFAILFSSFVVLEMCFNGHDILPLSLAVFICSLLLYFFNQKSKMRWGELVFISIFLGIISSSRIVFIILPFLFFSLMFKKNQKKAYAVFLISLVISICLHVYFYSINTFYQPFHLFIRGSDLVDYRIIILIASCVVVFLFLLSQRKIDDFYSWNIIIFIVFLTIFLPISYADLFRVNFDFKFWEAANYTVPVLPFFIVSVFQIMVSKKKI